MDITDFGTARFRAGYVVGNLLPYGFIGMAVGRASYNVTAVADISQCTPSGSTTICNDFPFANSVGQNNALLWGYSVGAGLDWALTPNIFVRGEFEFVQFAPLSNIAATLSTGRVGAGFKF